MNKTYAEKIFDYDPLTGSMKWRVTLSNHAAAGTEIHSIDDGHFIVSVHGVEYRASHIAWLLIHGQLPLHKMRFLDGNKLNLSAGNLDANGKRMKSEFVAEDFRKEFCFRDGLLLRKSTGDPAPDGFTVSAFGHRWTKSRLIWLMNYGSWPARDIEHINGDASDNRICNLRELKPLLGRKATYADFYDEFQYDPQTGAITKMCCGEKIIADQIDDTGTADGKYRRLYFSGKNWKSHRVAWLLHYGVWPRGVIDHQDHNGLNNRLENLRDTDSSGNAKNTPLRSSNKSGVAGVYETKGGKFESCLKVDGKKIHLGTFKTLKEATEAREKELKKHGFHPNHGK